VGDASLGTLPLSGGSTTGGGAPSAGGGASTSAAGSGARSVAGGPTRAVSADCGGTAGCAASGRLTVRVVSVGRVVGWQVQSDSNRTGQTLPTRSALGSTPTRGGAPSGGTDPELVAVRLEIVNHGTGSFLLQPGMLAVIGADGRTGRLVHPSSTRELVPRDGLRLESGESREGLIYFSLSPPQARTLTIRDASAPGGALTIPLS
jgi:hypothetical protein